MALEWGELTMQELKEITDLTNRAQTLAEMIKELDVELGEFAGQISNQKLALQSEITVTQNHLSHIRRPIVTEG